MLLCCRLLLFENPAVAELVCDLYWAAREAGIEKAADLRSWFKRSVAEGMGHDPASLVVAPAGSMWVVLEGLISRLAQSAEPADPAPVSPVGSSSGGNLSARLMAAAEAREDDAAGDSDQNNSRGPAAPSHASSSSAGTDELEQPPLPADAAEQAELEQPPLPADASEQAEPGPAQNPGWAGQAQRGISNVVMRGSIANLPSSSLNHIRSNGQVLDAAWEMARVQPFRLE